MPLTRMRSRWRVAWTYLVAGLAGGVLGWSAATFGPSPAHLARSVLAMLGHQNNAAAIWRKQRLAEIDADHSRYDIVMLGDSITEGGPWADMTIDGLSVANHGISGDTSADVLARLDITNRAAPSAIFLMIGVNDILTERYPGLLDRIEDIMDRLSADDRSLYVQSILLTDLGVDGLNASISIANDALARLCRSKPRCIFIDVNAVLAADGRLEKEVALDGLHINNLGYGRWSALIREVVGGSAGG